MANTLKYGFRPLGGVHTLIQVTAGGTFAKGDILAMQSAGTVVVFAPATHAQPFAVANEAAVSGDKVSAVLITDGALFAVATGLTFAATHLNGEYDITGATGAQYLTTTQTYRHCRIVGVHAIPGALDETGANTNVIVQFVLAPVAAGNARRLALRKSAATLAGDTAIGALIPAQVYALDPNGASRNVVLPAEAESLYFKIINTADAAENLVVKNDGGDTIGTLGQNEAADFFCDGTTWTGNGYSVAAI